VRKCVEVTEILDKMLRLDPAKRLTVKDCINLPFFDDIRVPKLEKGSPFRIYLGCDETLYSSNIDISSMQEIIHNEEFQFMKEKLDILNK